MQGVAVSTHSPSSPRIHTTAPPDPLPEAWARAVANSIAERLAREGWQTERQLYAWHATGNPSGYRYHPGGSIPPVLPSTELINSDIYVWGVVDPDHYPGLDIPPLAYALAQLDLAAALTARGDASDLMTAAQGWLAKCRRAARGHRTSPHVYRPKPNRHGNPKLQRADTALALEAEVFLIAARAATIRVVDREAYEEALADPAFQATTALAIIQRALGYPLQANRDTVTAS